MAFEEYYLSESAFAYPSSNANDGGEDNTEDNLRVITDKFTINNFVVKRKNRSDNYFLLRYSESPVGVEVTGGECGINGYYFKLENTVIKTSNFKFNPSTKYNVVLKIYKDGNGNLRGDGTELVGPNAGHLVCRGICLSLMTDEELENEDRDLILNLGYFTTDSQGGLPKDPASYILSTFRYSFIDSSTIITESGKTIEEWTKEILNYGLTHLSELNKYDTPESLTPSATLKITDDYKLTYTAGDIYFDIVELDSRTHVAESKGSTTPSFEGQSGPSGNTYNGESNLICRSDHNHDARYLPLNGDSPSVVHQDTTFASSLFIGTDPSTRAELLQDGSARFAQGSVSIESNADITSTGNITIDGVVRASKVYNAVWNDVAELYQKDDINDESPVGTLISKVRGKSTYAPSTQCTSKTVVGVISDTYGLLLGGDKDSSEEENLKKYYPIALSGRVKVRVVKGVVIEEGDLLFVSTHKGLATSANPCCSDRGTVVGKALESSDGSKEVILMQVALM